MSEQRLKVIETYDFHIWLYLREGGCICSEDFALTNSEIIRKTIWSLSFKKLQKWKSNFEQLWRNRKNLENMQILAKSKMAAILNYRGKVLLASTINQRRSHRSLFITMSLVWNTVRINRHYILGVGLPSSRGRELPLRSTGFLPIGRLGDIRRAELASDERPAADNCCWLKSWCISLLK